MYTTKEVAKECQTSTLFRPLTWSVCEYVDEIGSKACRCPNGPGTETLFKHAQTMFSSPEWPWAARSELSEEDINRRSHEIIRSSRDITKPSAILLQHPASPRSVSYGLLQQLSHSIRQAVDDMYITYILASPNQR